jgi:hypothetical protein
MDHADERDAGHPTPQSEHVRPRVPADSRASAPQRHAPEESETGEVLATWGSLVDEGVRPTFVEQTGPELDLFPESR